MKKIDFYCFCFDNVDQTDFSGMKARHGSHIFDNMNFDISNAKQLGKFAAFVKETGKFYDAHKQEIDLEGKRVFPRCIIPEMDTLLSALENAGADCVVSKDENDFVMNWANAINPTFRDVELTTLGEFLDNFESYKQKFGRVFFKTKQKNFSCEVLAAAKLGGELAPIVSDGEFGESNHKADFSDFFNEPMYIVITDSSKDHGDFRFGMLPKSTEVMVQPYLNLVRDEEFIHIPVEFRAFVVDGQFVVSRSWIPERGVPDGVKDYVRGVIDVMSEKDKTFVVDILEFEDEKGNRHFDLCEMNPISCSGYEIGSTIFVTEDEFEGKYYSGDKQDESQR